MTPAEIALSVDVSREFFNRSTRELKEENSSFAPVPGTYTAAAQVAHVAQTVRLVLRRSICPGRIRHGFRTHGQGSTRLRLAGCRPRLVQCGVRSRQGCGRSAL